MDEQSTLTTDRALKLIVKSSFVVLITVILSKLLTWAYRILIVKFYGAETYGLYSLLLMILGLFVTFGTLGLIDGLFMFVPKYRGEKKPAYAKYLVNYSILVLTVSGLISAILLYAMSDYLAVALFKDINFSIVLKIFSPLILVWIFSNLFVTLINAFEKIGWYAFISDVLSNLPRLIIILALILIGFSRNAVFISYGLSMIILFIISYFVFRSFASKILKKGKVPQSDKKTLKTSLFSYSWPIVFSGGILKLNGWIDSIIIAIFLSPLYVGFYNAAIPLALLIQVVPDLFYPLFFPIIARTLASKNKGVAKDISKQLGKWIFMVNLPIFLFLFIFAGPIISFVFDSDFVVAQNSLRILSVGAFIASILYISQKLLLVHGHSRTLLINSIVALLANLFLNILLVPKYGITGAAVSTSLVWIALGVAMTFQSLKLTSIMPLRRSILKIFLLSVVPLVVVLLLKNWAEENIFHIILTGILFMAVYATFIYFFALDKNDISIIKAIREKAFRRNKMVSGGNIIK